MAKRAYRLKEHSITIKRYTGQLDELGQRDRTQDPVIMAGVPAHIKALAGRQLEAARQIYASADFEAEIWPGEGWSLDEACYCIDDDTGRVFEIGYVQELFGKDWSIRLLLGIER